MTLPTPAAVAGALLLLLPATTPPPSPSLVNGAHSTQSNPSWWPALGASADRVQGDPALAVEAGAVRENEGGPSLALGARLLFARDTIVCVGLGPCPEGDYRPVALGLHAERRYGLLPAEGQGSIHTWGGPRAGVLVGRGRDLAALDLGGSVGVDARVGADLTVSLSARAGALVRLDSGGDRATGVVGMVGAFRWRP